MLVTQCNRSFVKVVFNSMPHIPTSPGRGNARDLAPVAGGSHVTTHVTGGSRREWGGSQNRNKMAATGDDAAAMDSISRAPAAQLAALNAAAKASGPPEAPEDAAEAPAVAPKKPGTNSG